MTSPELGKRTAYRRRKLGPATVVLLAILRAYVLVCVPLVIYAFLRATHGH